MPDACGESVEPEWCSCGGEGVATVVRRVTATVHGRVQGVYFRQSTRAEAVRLGLSGTVRNERDGTVRVVAEGDEAALQVLLDWLRHGPDRAEVERVDAEWTEPRGETGDLRIVG